MAKLLLLRLSALGDVIHTIPAAVALRAALPGTEIAWVVEAPYVDLVEIVAGVEAIDVRLKKWVRAPIASREKMGAAFRELRGADVSIDFQGLVKSALIGRLSGAPARYGFDRCAVRERASLVFTNRRVAVDTGGHVVEQNLQLARAVGEEIVVNDDGSPARGRDARAPRWDARAPRWDAHAPRWDEFPSDPSGKLASFRDAIVLLPGAGRRGKIWPTERFRELSRRLGDRAVVAWGPGERERAEAIGARLAPPTDLRELAWLLRQAALVIGGDTGPLHLAAALGTKVIGLYGPTDPRRNGPFGQVDYCLSSFGSTKWMDSIAVEEVMQMIERVVAE